MMEALLKITNFEYLLETAVNILPFTMIINIIPLFIIELSVKPVLILTLIFILQVYLLFKLSDIFE
ncbi:hypothetical protein KX935_07590 [Streptobacillus moniliformis]|uniref:Uncharacterized protein n=2 Tax=Streptobacillus moniliformis TaxID=34105 RepID=D1AX36_STRM9|nr:hypothetical protein [Streptobacillus moniliformis]ACZ00862.1 hypothetical protein Smon_0378 [Streptobacillus moniliformis DSM 12112]AVL42749.1 hypothetical protein CEP89_02310 [Streptobacillus moniliformis]QXW65609.1 hypothetical protein KX935_07590 [Streptobacillus moniliformis]SQA14003.1 Uncharacterised protein [Streptobacillus moniliformis]